MHRERSYDRLMLVERFAYNRWVKRRSGWWYALTVAANRAVKDHREYRGVR
jgi:hypothetical protein